MNPLTHDQLLTDLFSWLGWSASKPEEYRRNIISALTEVLSHGTNNP